MQRNSEHVLTEWLVLNAQCGKRAAMEELLRTWYPKFLRYASHQLSDTDAAKDVVQEALIAIAKTITQLKEPAAFPGWAYRIVHRRGVDHQRAAITRRRHEAHSSDGASTGNAPDEQLDSGRIAKTLLSSLDANSYSVIHLFYLHDLSLREIAKICDIPVGTVKSRLHYARLKIQKQLENAHDRY